MIIDFNVKEWQPNYLAFKDAGNVPAPLTKLETTDYQCAALGRRYVNPLGETFIYVKCDAGRGRTPGAAEFAEISILSNTYCWIEIVGFGTAVPSATTRLVYNVYPDNGGSGTAARYNAIALYSFKSSKPEDVTTYPVAWGLVKLLPSVHEG